MKTTENTYAICNTLAQRRFLQRHLTVDSGLVGIMFGRTIFDAGQATDGFRGEWTQDAAMINFVRTNFRECSFPGRRGVGWFRRECQRAARATKAKALALLPAGRGQDYMRRLIEDPLVDISARALTAKIKRLTVWSLTPAERECLVKYIWDLRDYALYLLAMDTQSLVIYDLESRVPAIRAQPQRRKPNAIVVGIRVPAIARKAA